MVCHSVLGFIPCLFPRPLPSFFPSLPFPSPTLKWDPLNLARGAGERCNLFHTCLCTCFIFFEQTSVLYIFYTNQLLMLSVNQNQIYMVPYVARRHTALYAIYIFAIVQCIHYRDVIVFLVF